MKLLSSSNSSSSFLIYTEDAASWYSRLRFSQIPNPFWLRRSKIEDEDEFEDEDD